MTCEKQIPHLNQGETLPMTAPTALQQKLAQIGEELAITNFSENEEYCNNHRMAVFLARAAKAGLADLLTNPQARQNAQLVKERLEEFRQALAPYNRGKVPAVDLKIDFEQQALNMDYQHMVFSGFGPVERTCRGFYVDLGSRTPAENPVLAYCMQKFYNLGEPDAYPIEKIKDFERIRFYEKIDGTMIVARRLNNGELFLGTRRMSDGVYVQKARYFLNAAQWQSWLQPDTTYSFEVVLPIDEDEMERAWGNEPGLYLLSSRNHQDGSSRMSDEIAELSSDSLIRKPKTSQFSNLEEAAVVIRDLTDTEGFVAVMNNDPQTIQNVKGENIAVGQGTLRYKIKTMDYLQKARLLAKVRSELGVDEVLASYVNFANQDRFQAAVSPAELNLLNDLMAKKPLDAAKVAPIFGKPADQTEVKKSIQNHFAQVLGDDIVALKQDEIAKISETFTQPLTKLGAEFEKSVAAFYQSPETNYKKFLFSKASTTPRLYQNLIVSFLEGTTKKGDQPMLYLLRCLGSIAEKEATATNEE